MPMKVPEAFSKIDPDQPSVISREQPSHYNDVRLVFPLPDPVTGALKDTIVANITMSKVFHDRREGEKRWTRYIAGTGIKIPWPAKEEKEYIDQPADTRIMDVEMKTYVPSLLKPPFPGSVVDELRNKYSKFRIRHEPEFVKKIQAQEKKRQEKEAVSVRTPVQELNRLQRMEKKARGPQVLTEEILEKIGRAMAQNRPELLERIQASPETHE
jgi:large subunit ribosomal protein L24